MLFSILAGGDIKSAVISLLLTLPIILIALSTHEASHAFIAYKMGDRTAYNLGRMTFNPIKHLDPIGFISMLIFGYGWAKPVPINARNFKNPKRGMAFTAIAGPVSNLILGVIGSVLYACSVYMNFRLSLNGISGFGANVAGVVMIFFYYFALMNLTLAVFNLIPLPPFDGSRFVSLFLPAKWYFKIMKYERYFMIGILLLSVICSRVFNFSPFFYVAEKLFEFFAQPVFRLLMDIAV